jgi:hypothetical protein
LESLPWLRKIVPVRGTIGYVGKVEECEPQKIRAAPDGYFACLVFLEDVVHKTHPTFNVSMSGLHLWEGANDRREWGSALAAETVLFRFSASSMGLTGPVETMITRGEVLRVFKDRVSPSIPIPIVPAQSHVT